MTWKIPASKRRKPRRIVAMINLAILLVVISSAANLAWPGEDLFEPAITIPLGGPSPRMLESGDFNEDGIADLISGNYSDYSISIIIGSGDGNFKVGNTYPLIDQPNELAVGNLQGDFHLDFVVSGPFAEPNLTAFRGNGRGGFAEDWFYSDGNHAFHIVLGDTGVDGDHDLDLIVAQPWENRVLLFTNNGDGAFTLDDGQIMEMRVDFIILADLTGDGNLDLVGTNQTDNLVSVLIYEDGGYRPPVDYPVGFNPNAVSAGDLDNDGDLDLAVSCYDDPLSILENNGNGIFGDPIDVDTFDTPISIKVGDFDLDGNQDLAVVYFVPDQVSVIFGNGDLTFYPHLFFETGSLPRDMVLEDLDRDFDLDIATANQEDGTISILLNTTLTPKSIITGPGPAESNPPLVRTFPPRPGAGYTVEFPAYGAQSYGANVSCGDLDGDGLDTILTGAGPGEVYGPHVRGFYPDGTPLEGVSFLAYGTNHWGVNVAAGDLDGDGYDEIVTGAGPGAVFGPHVRAWDYDGAPPVTAMPGVSYFAYGTPKWGVNVTTGDIDGDGYDEIVTGPGPGAVYGPHVRGWNVDGGSVEAMPLVSFLAYGTNKYGVEVSCGDVDGDGIDEIVTGAGPGSVFGAHLRGWDHDGATVTQLPGFSFFAWPPSQIRFGARIHAGTDLNGDGRTDLVVGPGPDSRAGSPIKVFGYDGKTALELFSLEAFPGLSHGTSVSAGSL